MPRLVALTLILIPFVSVSAAEPVTFFEPVKPARRVQTIAHRGMAMLTPENTLPAIAACAADYVEWAEVDVRLTRDGHHVLMHDDTLDRTTIRKAKVADATLAELRKLDAGVWLAPRFADTPVPTLADALAAAKGKVNLYLDCKQIDPDQLAKDVLAAGMESQVVVFGNPDVLARVRAASGGRIPTMTKYRAKLDVDTFLKDVRPTAVEIDADEVTAGLCRRFRAAGVKVQAKVLGAEWDNPGVWAKVVAAGVDWVQTDDPVGFRAWDLRARVPSWPVRIAYHRGANRYAPENTLPAIKEAARLGADYVEIDIRPSKDGRFILLHDRTLNRTTTGTGPVTALAFDEVAKLDAGKSFGKRFTDTRVPTLDAALAALGDRAHVYLDAKDIPPEHLLAAIKKHGLMDRHVVYQSREYLAKLKQLDPNVRPLPPLKTAADLPAVAELKPYGVDANWSILSKELIADCHARGIKVFSDALGRNETVEQYRKAIGWGIDLIQTDYPARVFRAIELEATADEG
ncbi:MAG: ugpQ 1, partial [Gemmataceae bacterium]|nr:ugpQ 1 [Gemmataceae bacterium]